MRSLPLGFSPAAGNDAVAQGLHFKTVLRGKLGREPDGACLGTVTEGRRRGLVAYYDPDVPGATEWARQAREHAEWCWEQVVGQRVRQRA